MRAASDKNNERRSPRRAPVYLSSVVAAATTATTRDANWVAIALFVNLDDELSGRIDVAAIHAVGIEGQGHRPVFVDRNQTTLAAEILCVVERGLSGLLQFHSTMLDERGDFMRHGCANKIFAVTRARHSAGRVVRISPSANDGRIADPTGFFVARSAGRGGRGQIPTLIESDRADRSMSVLICDNELLFASRAAFLGFLNFLERIPAFLREKVFLVPQELDTVLLGKSLRSFTRHEKRTDTGRFQSVLGFHHEETRETDWIADVTQVRDRTGFERFAVHDGSVELVRAGIGKHRALAGIEVRIILEDTHGRFCGVETG